VRAEYLLATFSRISDSLSTSINLCTNIPCCSIHVVNNTHKSIPKLLTSPHICQSDSFNLDSTEIKVTQETQLHWNGLNNHN
jgi:hypothetical protein